MTLKNNTWTYLLKFSIIGTKAFINNGIFNSKTLLHELTFLQVSLPSWSKLLLNQIFKLCVTSNNNFLNELLFSEFRQEMKFLPPLEFSKKRFFILVSYSTDQKKLHTQKKQGSQLKQQILKNFRFCSLQFVCYTKTYFSKTKDSLSFFFFGKEMLLPGCIRPPPKKRWKVSENAPKILVCESPSKFMVFFLTALILRESYSALLNAPQNNE